jgi:hypothetical protein
MPNVEITSHKPICGPKILLRPIITPARLILQAHRPLPQLGRRPRRLSAGAEVTDVLSFRGVENE